jgi:hypothetical protein
LERSLKLKPRKEAAARLAKLKSELAFDKAKTRAFNLARDRKWDEALAASREALAIRDDDEELAQAIPQWKREALLQSARAKEQQGDLQGALDALYSQAEVAGQQYRRRRYRRRHHRHHHQCK